MSILSQLASKIEEDTQAKNKKEDQFFKPKLGENKIRILSDATAFYEFFLDKKTHRAKVCFDKNSRDEFIKNVFNPIIEEAKKTNKKIKTEEDFYNFKKTFSDWKTKEAKDAFQLYEKENTIVKIKISYNFVVFDYYDQKIKVANFTQNSINEFILNLAKDEEVKITDFDLKIHREGENQFDTKYIVSNSKFCKIEDLKLDIVNKNTSEVENISIVDLYDKYPCDIDALERGTYPFEDIQNITPLYK